mgnify:CR=1 FL=1
MAQRHMYRVRLKLFHPKFQTYLAKTQLSGSVPKPTYSTNMEKLTRSLFRLSRISHLRLQAAPPITAYWTTVRHYNTKPPASKKVESFARPIGEILDREIHEETAELSQHLTTDQFPGFSVETDDSDVKLTKQIGNTTTTIRFSVSSSLNEWPSEPQDDQNQAEGTSTKLVSMPEFQVQISKNNQTLEVSCFFEEMELDEESGEPYASEPMFAIDELVMYEGEPKETEFAVSAEYFQEDLQAALIQYLAEHGVDEEFSKNLVAFATSYEKKQYVGLMRRLRGFVSK